MLVGESISVGCSMFMLAGECWCWLEKVVILDEECRCSRVLVLVGGPQCLMECVSVCCRPFWCGLCFV